MESLNKTRLEFTHDQQVLELTLNAPKGNVLDQEMMSELSRAIDEESQRTEVKALVFKGEGDHFSFGASVPEHRRESVGEMLATFHQVFRSLIHASKPTFALVRGQCLGGGLELAAFCHWIFCSENAKFGQPEIQLAVFAPVASLILPVRIGQSAADNLLLAGNAVSADVARQLRLVHSVSTNPEAELDAFLINHILSKSAAALKFAVKSSRYEMNQTFFSMISAVEKMYVQELMETQDANEGIQAFMEKRKPIWKNS
ncbi:enoyl-CoA hydratase-related protein [bacterium]|nr:enoyl-CoA hydratase-related protein [bacterium]